MIILMKYLSEHGINAEITRCYTIKLLFTIGMTKGRWNTIISTLQQFKMDHDSNRPLWRIMPKLSSKHCWGNKGLKDVCGVVRGYYLEKDISGVLMGLGDPTPTLLPCKAFEQIARRNTERVPISSLTGRIAVSTIISHPNGVPLIIPGEMFHANLVNFLEIMLDMKRVCPGFECCVDGVGHDKELGFFVDCVKDKDEIRYRTESISL